MERSKKKDAGRKTAVPRLVNESQLVAILKSRKGDECVVRLVETLRQAWCRIQELEGEPPEGTEQRERDWSSFERVLVTSETDGAVEIYAESWVSVKHVEVKPWDVKDELVESLSADWKRLYVAPKSKCLIAPQIRPKLDDETLAKLCTWHERACVIDGLRRLRK